MLARLDEDDEPAEAARRKTFDEGHAKHFVDVYVLLKRNIEIKTAILVREQVVCELVYAPSAPDCSRREHWNKLRDDVAAGYRECRDAHGSLLSQTFPDQYDRRFDDATTAPSYDVSPERRIDKSSASAVILDSAVAELAVMEHQILKHLQTVTDSTSASPSPRPVDAREEPDRGASIVDRPIDTETAQLQDMVRARFRRVNVMMSDVSAQMIEEQRKRKTPHR